MADLSEKVAALRERIGKVDTSMGDKRFWRPPQGRSIIRILPPTGEMELFLQAVGQHYNLPDGQREYCPAYTTSLEENEDYVLRCPICELVETLYKGTASDKELARQLRVSKAFWMNVIVRDELAKDDPEGVAGTGPFIYTPGLMVFQQIQALVLNPDYGDISNVAGGRDGGIDLYIDREGEGINTKYQVNARRKDNPLHTDSGQVKEWLEAAEDLTYVELTGDPEQDKELSAEAIVGLLPYEVLAEKYGLGPGIDVAALASRIQKDNGSDGDNGVREVARRTRRSKEPEAEIEDEVGSELRARRAARRPRRRG